jgi:hypothetical protein
MSHGLRNPGQVHLLVPGQTLPRLVPALVATTGELERPAAGDDLLNARVTAPTIQAHDPSDSLHALTLEPTGGLRAPTPVA